jgi:hypothetical protein
VIKWLKQYISVEFTVARNYTNTIEGILSGWTKTIRDLEAHSVEHTKQAIVKTEEAGRLLAQRVTHAEEAAKASDLVGKFKALIG